MINRRITASNNCFNAFFYIPEIYFQRCFQQCKAFRKADRFAAEACQPCAKGKVFTLDMISAIAFYAVQVLRNNKTVNVQAVGINLFAFCQSQRFDNSLQVLFIAFTDLKDPLLLCFPYRWHK